MCILDSGRMKRPPALMFSVNVVSVISQCFHVLCKCHLHYKQTKVIFNIQLLIDKIILMLIKNKNPIYYLVVATVAIDTHLFFQ